MRSHLRAAAASDPTQPSPGDRYMKCRHVRGSAETGFKSAHILYIQGSAPSMQRFAGQGERTLLLAVRWLILCDPCYEQHRTGEDNGVFVGSDHEWPEGATITYEAKH